MKVSPHFPHVCLFAWLAMNTPAPHWGEGHSRLFLTMLPSSPTLYMDKEGSLTLVFSCAVFFGVVKTFFFLFLPPPRSLPTIWTIERGRTPLLANVSSPTRFLHPHTNLQATINESTPCNLMFNKHYMFSMNNVHFGTGNRRIVSILISIHWQTTNRSPLNFWMVQFNLPEAICGQTLFVLHYLLQHLNGYLIQIYIEYLSFSWESLHEDLFFIHFDRLRSFAKMIRGRDVINAGNALLASVMLLVSCIFVSVRVFTVFVYSPSNYTFKLTWNFDSIAFAD